MARFARLEVLNSIVDIGLVPVFYNEDLDTATKIVAACRSGGARVVEFTNRGDLAYEVFAGLVRHFAKADPSLILGVGSVVDPGTAALYIASGANFVVGPILNPDVARICNRRKVAYSPGCGSASEISEAEEMGVEIVKVFPGGEVGGPAFVKAVLGPCPWTRIMPTGGVDASEESINSWFKAGVAAVGIGSNLITREIVSSGDYDSLSAKTSQVIGWIKKARGKSIFEGVEHVGIHPAEPVTGKEIADWYGEVFGFRVREGNSSFFASSSGPGRIEIMKKGEGGCHIAVKVSDFEAAVEALRSKGIELENFRSGPGLKAAFLRQTDPAGNLVHILWNA